MVQNRGPKTTPIFDPFLKYPFFAGVLAAPLNPVSENRRNEKTQKMIKKMDFWVPFLGPKISKKTCLPLDSWQVWKKGVENF